MEQVEEMCDHIVLINRGKNVLEGEVKAVKQRFKENLFSIEYEGDLPEKLRDMNPVFTLKTNQDNRMTVQMAEGTRTNDVLQQFIGSGVQVRSFNEILPSINEIFIKTVGS